MYQVIARKYRPLSFADLVNQKHVRTTLENAIIKNRIAHGYIFSGQRGTGKTTVARIVARCMNCAEGPTITPCGKCPSCLEISSGSSVDVIEIDAASNRGINEIRELRENVRYRPARGRYKVFIIDEAHQITNEAFNALLKTLEEPPEWVVFILCTTETHKIPATISSRCQQFSFRAVDFEEIVERMAWICQQEGISAGPEVLAVLAQAGEGSVRDSLSALDQAIACCGTDLSADEVRRLLGLFSLEALHEVTTALAEANSQRMLELVDELEATGQNLQHFCRELARYFRNLLVVQVAGADSRLVGASPNERRRLAEIAASFSREDLTRYLQVTLSLFQDLQYSTQPRLHMELGLLKLVDIGRLRPLEEVLAGLPPSNGPGSSTAPAGSGSRGSGRPSGNPFSAKPIAGPADTGVRSEDLPAATVTRAAGGGSITPPPKQDLPKQPPLQPPPPQQDLPPVEEPDLDPPPVSDPPPFDDTDPGDAPIEEPESRTKDPAEAETGEAPPFYAPADDDEPPPIDDWGPEVAAVPPAGNLQSRLVSALRDLGLSFTADAVRQSDLEEDDTTLLFRTPKRFSLAMSEAEIRKGLSQLGLTAKRIQIQITADVKAKAAEPEKLQVNDQELLDRAMANPEVQRYQQIFNGQIRDVNNLRL